MVTENENKKHLVGLVHDVRRPSIHLFIFCNLSKSQWQQAKKVILLPNHVLQLLLEDLDVFPGLGYIILQCVLGPPWGLLPVGRVEKTFTGRCLGGF